MNTIYIGLDEFMFDFENLRNNGFKSYIFNPNIYNDIAYFFSYDALSDRIKVLIKNKKYVYDKYGNKKRLNVNKPTENTIKYYLQQRLKEIKEGLHKFDYNKFLILKNLVKYCKLHNIKLHFIYKSYF